LPNKPLKSCDDDVILDPKLQNGEFVFWTQIFNKFGLQNFF
jgi:hypothetical protein